MIKIALTKGRIEKEVCNLFKKSGFDTESIENKNRKLKIKTKDDLEIIFVKPNDVLNFTQKGIVDIGIVGKDTLKANGLEIIDKICDISTRVIVNNNSLQERKIEIEDFIDRLKNEIKN